MPKNVCYVEEEEEIVLKPFHIEGHTSIHFKDQSNNIYGLTWDHIGRIDGNKIKYYTYDVDALYHHW